MTIEELVNGSWKHELDKEFHAGELFDGSDKQVDHVYKKIALTLSELSELIESMRKGTLYDKCDKPIPLNNAEEEWADAMIRLAGIAALLDLKEPSNVIRMKMTYNSTRPIKHGKNS